MNEITVLFRFIFQDKWLLEQNDNLKATINENNINDISKTISSRGH